MPDPQPSSNLFLRMHPLHRFLLSVILAVVIVLFIPHKSVHPLLLCMVLWIVFALAYNVMAWIILFKQPIYGIKKIARQNDGSKAFVFIMVLISCFASLFTVLALMTTKSAEAYGHPLFIPVAISGMLLAWVMVHTIFAIHYAHLYYDEPEQGDRDTAEGLLFPGDKEPDYLDFAYFSFVVGCAFQVSDVQVTSQKIRRRVMVHGLLSFVLNTFVVALTINLIAGINK